MELCIQQRKKDGHLSVIHGHQVKTQLGQSAQQSQMELTTQHSVILILQLVNHGLQVQTLHGPSIQQKLVEPITLHLNMTPQILLKTELQAQQFQSHHVST